MQLRKEASDHLVSDSGISLGVLVISFFRKTLWNLPRLCMRKLASRGGERIQMGIRFLSAHRCSCEIIELLRQLVISIFVSR